jgi:hypothetical protein
LRTRCEMAEHADGPDLAFLLEIFVDNGWARKRAV